MELVIGEMRDAALTYASGAQESPTDASSAELATAPDAVVVCGYGEMGQGACDVLANAEGVGGGMGDELRDQVALPGGAWGTQFIAFDRNPSRISIGLAKQVRVVYGDGASASLIQAAGVSRPRAIVVTYANDKRCLEATSRLRDAYPEAPIFVRARTANEAEPLLQAGATEVIVEAVESVVRIASLLGSCSTVADTLLRVPMVPLPAPQLPYPPEQLESLAAECGITRTQITRLYDGFSMLDANDDGEVSLAEIRKMLTRVGAAPVKDEELKVWMAKADGDGSNTLSFFEYVRVDTQLSAAVKQPKEF